MSDLSHDEQQALAAFRKRVNLQFYLRLVAVEIAIVAFLARAWSGDWAAIAAMAGGSALIARSVHVVRVNGLLRTARRGPDNALITLSTLTDLAAEGEGSRFPVDRLTLLVVGLCLAVALILSLA